MQILRQNSSPFIFGEIPLLVRFSRISRLKYGVLIFGTLKVMKLKSCIKLFGPRISDGIEALEAMVKEVREDVSFSRIMTRMDPSLDLMTEQMMADGEEVLGEYDFVIEWRITPPPGRLRELIRKLDRVLDSTGCRYTITTK